MSGAFVAKCFVFQGWGPYLTPFYDSNTLVTEEVTYLKAPGCGKLNFREL